jgi:hypothetical protein
MSKWNQTFRAVGVSYVEQGEVEFVMTRFYEAGERLKQALLHKQKGGDIPQEYIDVLVADWDSLRTRHKLD